MDEPTTPSGTQGQREAGALLAKLESLQALLAQLEEEASRARSSDDWLDVLLRTASDELAVARRSLQFARDALASVE